MNEQTKSDVENFEIPISGSLDWTKRDLSLKLKKQEKTLIDVYRDGLVDIGRGVNIGNARLESGDDPQAKFNAVLAFTGETDIAGADLKKTNAILSVFQNIAMDHLDELHKNSVLIINNEECEYQNGKLSIQWEKSCALSNFLPDQLKQLETLLIKKFPDIHKKILDAHVDENFSFNEKEIALISKELIKKPKPEEIESEEMAKTLNAILLNGKIYADIRLDYNIVKSKKTQQSYMLDSVSQTFIPVDNKTNNLVPCPFGIFQSRVELEEIEGVVKPVVKSCVFSPNKKEIFIFSEHKGQILNTKDPEEKRRLIKNFREENLHEFLKLLQLNKLPETEIELLFILFQKDWFSFSDFFKIDGDNNDWQNQLIDFSIDTYARNDDKGVFGAKLRDALQKDKEIARLFVERALQIFPSDTSDDLAKKRHNTLINKIIVGEYIMVNSGGLAVPEETSLIEKLKAGLENASERIENGIKKKKLNFEQCFNLYANLRERNSALAEKGQKALVEFAIRKNGILRQALDKLIKEKNEDAKRLFDNFFSNLSPIERLERLILLKTNPVDKLSYAFALNTGRKKYLQTLFGLEALPVSELGMAIALYKKELLSVDDFIILMREKEEFFNYAFNNPEQELAKKCVNFFMSEAQENLSAASDKVKDQHDQTVKKIFKILLIKTDSISEQKFQELINASNPNPKILNNILYNFLNQPEPIVDFKKCFILYKNFSEISKSAKNAQANLVVYALEKGGNFYNDLIELVGKNRLSSEVLEACFSLKMLSVENQNKLITLAFENVKKSPKFLQMLEELIKKDPEFKSLFFASKEKIRADAEKFLNSLKNNTLSDNRRIFIALSLNPEDLKKKQYFSNLKIIPDSPIEMALLLLDKNIIKFERCFGEISEKLDNLLKSYKKSEYANKDPLDYLPEEVKKEIVFCRNLQKALINDALDNLKVVLGNLNTIKTLNLTQLVNNDPRAKILIEEIAKNKPSHFLGFNKKSYDRYQNAILFLAKLNMNDSQTPQNLSDTKIARVLKKPSDKERSLESYVFLKSLEKNEIIENINNKLKNGIKHVGLNIGYTIKAVHFILLENNHKIIQVQLLPNSNLKDLKPLNIELEIPLEIDINSGAYCHFVIKPNENNELFSDKNDLYYASLVEACIKYDKENLNRIKSNLKNKDERLVKCANLFKNSNSAGINEMAEIVNKNLNITPEFMKKLSIISENRLKGSQAYSQSSVIGSGRKAWVEYFYKEVTKIFHSYEHDPKDKNKLLEKFKETIGEAEKIKAQEELFLQKKIEKSETASPAESNIAVHRHP